MTNQRWLAIYVDQHGKPRAAMIAPRSQSTLPFAADEFELGLADYDGEPVTLVEMPDEVFRPAVIDVETDEELPVQFVEID